MTVSRGEQKERTRRAILDAALELSAEGGLGAVSLRQVAKQVGVVPTAFYRHFASIDELGLALVEESFDSLRTMMRQVRRDRPMPAEIIQRSVATLADHVGSKRQHFAFISRERSFGSGVVGDAVRHQLELVERELATDLAQLTGPRWTSEDLQILANLIVRAMVTTAEDLVAAERRPEWDAICARAVRQLRMVVVGARQWRSDFTH